MRRSKTRITFNIINYTLLACFAFTILYPLFNQVAISFSSTSGILQGDVGLIPIEFTIDTYSELVEQSAFWRYYLNTIFYTVLGTIISLTLTTMCAYSLSKKGVMGRSFVLKLIIFTMFFAGGLIPNFALIRTLGWINEIWAVLIPGAIIPYHVLIMRTYFEGLPSELEEASKIDGLGEFGHFIKIALPLSKPIIATMVLFIAVIYWNDWFAALLYLNDQDLQPVTLHLRNLLMGAVLAMQTGTIDSANQSIPQSVQAASMIVVTAPVLCIYPFVQKYFVKGVMIGSVKG